MMLTALIEKIRPRTVEIGRCWEWQAAVNPSGPTPVMRMGRQVVQVRRVLAQAAQLDLDGRVAIAKCGNPLCVNPAHVATATRQYVSTQAALEHRAHVSPLTRKKIADRIRARSRLTLEIAQLIREAEGSQRAIAARFGTDQKTVWLIKHGRAWIDYANPFAQLIRN